MISFLFNKNSVFAIYIKKYGILKISIIKIFKLFLEYCSQKSKGHLPHYLAGALFRIYLNDSIIYYRDVCSSYMVYWQ